MEFLPPLEAAAEGGLGETLGIARTQGGERLVKTAPAQGRGEGRLEATAEHGLVGQEIAAVGGMLGSPLLVPPMLADGPQFLPGASAPALPDEKPSGLLEKPDEP